MGYPLFIVYRLEEIVCRVVELFVCHASLLRPIGEGGKLKLAADMAQVRFYGDNFINWCSD